MKILFWHPDLNIGGTQKNMQYFCVGLAQRGYECAICYYEDGAEDRLENYKSIVLVNPLVKKEFYSIKIFKISRENKQDDFNQVLRDFQPDIVHLFRSGFVEFPEPGRDFVTRGLNKKIWACETNVFGHIGSSPHLDKTIFMSEYLMRYIARVPQSDLYDFIPIPAKEPVSDVKIDRRSFPPSTIILGRCGRPDNGIYDPIAVEAVHILLERRPELERKILFLLLAPPENMIKDLQKYEISYLIQPTTVNDIVLDSFYNSIDILCHARRDGETCGSVIEEAMAHKKPVITHVSKPSDPATFPFQAQCSLVEDGKTGYVVDHDPKLYADALEELIDNGHLREKMGQAGYEKAMRDFELSKCLDKLEGIYRDLVNDD